MKKKNIILSLGLVITSLPIVTVVACRNDKPITPIITKITIDKDKVQTALDEIKLVELSVTGNDKVGVITKITLDGLAKGDLEHTIITASKTSSKITNNEEITLTATPIEGYQFGDGTNATLDSTTPIIVSGLSKQINIIEKNKVQTALNKIVQTDLKITGDNGSGQILETTLTALAKGDLENTIITTDAGAKISNGTNITLTATPKEGYQFGDGTYQTLTHEITINNLLKISINFNSVQIALDKIVESDLGIQGNNGMGKITTTTLSFLSWGDLEHTIITACKNSYITNGDDIDLTATPKDGYRFSNDERELESSKPIIISNLS